MSLNRTNDSSNRREDWQSPKWLFDFLVEECNTNFQIDCAADADNTLCPFWLDEKDDFLAQTKFDPMTWHWANPPYLTGRQKHKKLEWMYKLMSVPKIVCLLPAAIGAEWFQTIWDGADCICFLRKRLKFVHPEQGELAAAQFDSCLAIRGTGEAYFHALTQIGNVVLLREPGGGRRFGQYCGQ